jgi:anti-sigma factor RsiW
MESNPADDELLRSYLLGELPEDEADRLERRLLAEDALFELSEAIEADLLAEYAQGGLAPAERERVQRRLASSPQGRERLKLARSLSVLAGRDPQSSVLPFARRVAAPRHPAFRWMALAAGLFVAAGLSWFALERPYDHQEAHESPAPVIAAVPRAHEVPKPPAPVVTPAPERVKAVFQLALTSLRGAESAEKLRVPAGAGTVELQISVEGMDDLASFHLTVRNRKAQIVQEWKRLEPRNLNGIRALVVDLPAERLPAGRYEIQAQGLAPGGEPEELSPMEVEVVRTGGS